MNFLLDAKEEETSIAAAKTLNDKDVPTLNKRWQLSKREKINASAKKKTLQKTTKKATKKWWICWFKLGRRMIHSEVAKLWGQNVDND